MEERKTTIIRFGIIFFIICLLFMGIVYKIVRTQYFERERYIRVADRIGTKMNVIEASRGNIYDCQHRLLAASQPTYHYFMDTKVDSLRRNNGKLFFDNVDGLAECLSAYFGDKTKAEYKRKLLDGYNKKQRRMYLTPRRVTYTELQKIKQFPLINRDRYTGGCYSEEGYRRVNPYGSLAKRTIGSIYAETGRGVSGLELQYDAQLRGQRTCTTEMEEETSVRPKAGKDIITTLDADLQDFVENSLRNALVKTHGDWGCCILMETKTGEIKAISNLTEQPNGVYIESVNYAVQRVEPGSTFKTASLMAALDAGKINITDSIEVGNGTWIYQDEKRPIRDAHKPKAPIISVKQAFASSSNVALAKIITSSFEKKASKFVEKIEDMGLTDTLPIAIPGAQSPIIKAPKDNETLARMSFGYFVEQTPMDILTFYNAIANDGKMIRPILVKQIVDDGCTVKSFTTSTIESSICKRSTLRDVRECLEAVVWDDDYGTASMRPWSNKAQSKRVRIAGKTGTAQVLLNGKYQRNQHRIAFCGYFPADKPQYTCICMIQHPKNGGYDAGTDCGGTVRLIAEKVMALTAENEIVPIPKDSLKLPTIKRGMTQAVRTAARGTEVKVKNRIDSDWSRVTETYEIAELPVSQSLVPNVVGMGAKDAVYAIEQTGMIAKLQGHGKVVQQSVQAGAQPLTGGIVYLTLR